MTNIACGGLMVRGRSSRRATGESHAQRRARAFPAACAVQRSLVCECSCDSGDGRGGRGRDRERADVADCAVRGGDRRGDRRDARSVRVARQRGVACCARRARVRRRGRWRRQSDAPTLAVDRRWLHTGCQAGGWKTPVDPRVEASSSSAGSVMATSSSYARDRAAQQELAIAILLGTVVLLGSAVIAIAWSLPMIAAWVHSGRVAHLGALDALEALVNGRLYGGDPASAYPLATARLLPGAWGFWSVVVLSLIGVTAVIGAVGRRVEIAMSRPTADRRWWQLRGRRPHEFGRYRTVRPLVVHEASPERVIVGRIAHPSALVAIEAAKQAAVIAAPQVGKTSGLIIPAVLEHGGPVAVTSTKTDVVLATIARRRRMGEVFVWDPFGEQSDCWDPLQGCEDWEHALLVAKWLGAARLLRDSSNQQYFDEEAQELTAPLLHAAAISGEHTILDVYRWVRQRERDTPNAILASAEADAGRAV